MSKPKYKVGDKFKSSVGIHEVFGALESASGDVYYWVDDDGDRECTTCHEGALDGWEKIEPFFEEGVTYAHRSTVESLSVYATWKIVKVYELDRKRHVFALYERPDGYRSMVIFNGKYSEMEEVAWDSE
jgi:hypothetical protein